MSMREAAQQEVGDVGSWVFCIGGVAWVGGAEYQSVISI